MQYIKKIALFLIIILNINFIVADEIYDKNQRGVVLIIGEKGFGSGVIISEQGHILTNSHVINENPNFEILLHKNHNLDSYEEYLHEAILLKNDKSKDLALLKIKNPRTLLYPVKVSRKMPQIGDKVHAIGHPDLAIWTFTTGYISQIRNDFEWSYKDGSEMVANVYQTQTPIAEGNSGGPLLNDYGNLIGINTFKDFDSNFQNFSISVEEIVKFLIK